MSRGWWRDYCYDHPLFKHQDKVIQAQSLVSGKPKVHCKLCFEQIVQRELERDARAVQSGSLTVARTDDFLRSAAGPIWMADRGRKENTWIIGRPETILNHLKECVLQTEETRARARSTLQEHRIRGTPTKRRYNDVGDNNAFTSTVLPPPLPALTLPAGQSDTPNTFGASALMYPPQSSALFSGASGFGYSPAPSSSSLNPSGSGTPASTNLSPIAISGGYLPHAALGSYSPLTSSPSPAPGPSSKRPRSHAAGLSRSGSRNFHSPGMIAPAYGPGEWTKAHQDRLEYRLMRITASAGFSLTWTENPEVHLLLEEFISPAAHAPSRNTIVNRILPNTLNHLREAQMKSISSLKHRYGTVQFDGWTGMNQRYYHAFLVSLQRKLHTVEVSDCSLSRKTGDNLYGLLVQVIAKLEDPQGQWSIMVIAVCSDGGPDPSKARRLLRRVRMDVISLDCYGHQTNLLVGGFFKIDGTWYLVYAKVADELITWLRSKTQLIAVLKVTQEAMNPGKKGLAVLRAVLTRWTTHYLAYRRLLILKLPLQSLLENDSQLPPEQQCVVIGDRQARLKAENMVKVINDPKFWAALERMKRNLEPLAIASNISQAAHVRLDQVLLLFGLLYLRYLRLSDPEDNNVREGMLHAIEARWKKVDQDVFIATLILNPYHKLRPLASLHALTPAGVYILMQRLWQRFHPTEASQPVLSELWSNVMDYLNETGIYANMSQLLPMVQSAAAHNGTMQKDPMQVWTSLTHVNLEPPPLTKLAYRLLSVCANSASCERLFSTFGLILTRLRNRMSNQTLVSLAELKMLIRDDHIKSGDVKKRLKRHFGPPPPPPMQASGSQSTLPLPPGGQTIAAGSTFESHVLSSQPGPSSAATTAAPPSAYHTTDTLRQSGADSANDLTNPSLPSAEASNPNLSDAQNAPSSESDTNPSMQDFATNFMGLVDREDYERCVPDTTRYPNQLIFTISELFNFQDTYWHDSSSATGEQGLADEEELSELLDAAGGIGIDEAAEAVFSNT